MAARMGDPSPGLLPVKAARRSTGCQFPKSRTVPPTPRSTRPTRPQFPPTMAAASRRPQAAQMTRHPPPPNRTRRPPVAPRPTPVQIPCVDRAPRDDCHRCIAARVRPNKAVRTTGVEACGPPDPAGADAGRTDRGSASARPPDRCSPGPLQPPDRCSPTPARCSPNHRHVNGTPASADCRAATADAYASPHPTAVLSAS